jgi:flagellar motor protein MotB
MPKLQNKARKINVLEWIGVGAFLLFFAGLFFYERGWDFYTDKNGWELWLPLVIGFPFFIQIPIFFRFLIIYYKKDKSLETFFIFYSIFMCAGLTSYSFFWWIYNAFNIESWSPKWLTFLSILSLASVLFLIWSIINCTRIVTRSSFEISDGLLDSSELSHEQYEELCSKLDTILECSSVLDYDFNKLKEVIQSSSTTDSVDETEKKKVEEVKKDHYKIQKIINAFSDSGKINFPVTDDTEAEKLISVIIDANHPARIKPLKRILLLLRENNNHWIHRAISTRKFQEMVTKHLLIKAINKILKNPEFFDKKEFSAADLVTTTSEYFRKNKKRYLPEKVQLENRKLFDEHVLKLLNDPNSKPISEEDDDFESTKPKHWSVEWGEKIIKQWLTDDKGLKIKEGIARFPFETMSFFFTIFLCIIYLFSFSFAFHDKSELSETRETTPALFMSKDFSSSNSNINSNIIANTSTDNKSNIAPNPNTNTNSNANVSSNSSPENEIYRHPTRFVFYASSGSGIETVDNNTIKQNANVSLKKNSNSAISPESQELQSYRYRTNNQNFNDLLEIIRKKAPGARTIYVEIIGRADDSPQGSSKQTYSSNYELSLARAQNLKFELIRKLQDTPDILEKIEWSCLPVSNDQSLGGDHPLNDSNSRPSIALNNSSNLDINDMIKRIDETFKTFPETDGDKNRNQLFQVLEKKTILLNHISEARELLKDGKITSKSAGEVLFTRLKKEFECYGELANVKIANLMSDSPQYKNKENEFVELQTKIDEALKFFKSGADNANKRVTEIYVTSIPKQNDIVRKADLKLIDYILYTITKGTYGGIKPLTKYSKFLSVFVNIIDVFFLVVFFNALLSVKRVNEEDEAFNSA